MIIGYFPVLFKTYYHLWKLLCEAHDCLWVVMCFPLFVIANALLPAGVALAAAFGILYCLVVGAGTCILAYRNGICEGLEKAYTIILEVWETIFDGYVCKDG